MGTVTFLFTDLVGSSRLWEEHPEVMKGALARHDVILRDAVEGHGGQVVKTTGDGLHAAFAVAPDALAAALDAQRRLTGEEWVLPEPLKVRMGLHTGVAEVRGGDYYGTAVNRAARVAAVAHGGQIVASAATADLVRDDLSPEVALLDLGEHRLRDLGRPERIAAVTHPDLPADFPALRSLDAYPGNLPVQRSSFVGRAEDLAGVRVALEGSPVITLTGVGGVGKTRLALQVAADVVARFPDGAWFVDLGPVLDAGYVAAALSASLLLPERRRGTLEESIVAGLREKRLLVVLDNCEHVIAAVADLVDTVVGSCPGVSVLATSREALGVEGEDTYEVRPLAMPARCGCGVGLDVGQRRHPPVRRACPLGQARVRALPRERLGRRRDLSAPRRHPACHRAGGARLKRGALSRVGFFLVAETLRAWVGQIEDGPMSLVGASISSGSRGRPTRTIPADRCQFARSSNGWEGAS
jgi:class 3 adenylate cyclase